MLAFARKIIMVHVRPYRSVKLPFINAQSPQRKL